MQALKAAFLSCFRAEMKKELLDGKTLVVDRYAFSGVAYTSAKVKELYC